MTRASRVLWIALVAVACVVPALAEDTPSSEQPPVVHYPGSRSSSNWVELPGGSRVGVDKGAEWRGVKVYLSMTWDLVGVDTSSGKTLFGTHVGAYWNAFTFKEVTPKDGKRVWAVELQPGGRRADKSRRQYHDLRTGKKLAIPGLVQTPAGKPFELRASWQGDASDVAKPFKLVVTTEKSWIALQERMFPAVDPAKFGAIDFAQEVVFAISSGNSSNCSGFVVKAAYEDEDRVLLRIDRNGFQTMNGYQKTRPWGFFVLPRRAKAYEVEIDSQGLIRGPSIWKSVFKIERLPAPQRELAGLPPKSDKSHHGWANDGSPSERPPPPPPGRPK